MGSTRRSEQHIDAGHNQMTQPTVSDNQVSNEWKPGEIGYYLLPRSPRNGRPADLYLRVRVRKMANKPGRIVIEPPDESGMWRTVCTRDVYRHPPDGAWIR